MPSEVDRHVKAIVRTLIKTNALRLAPVQMSAHSIERILLDCDQSGDGVFDDWKQSDEMWMAAIVQARQQAARNVYEDQRQFLHSVLCYWLAYRWVTFES